VLRERLVDRAPGPFPDAEGLGGRRQPEVVVADRGQGNEEDPIGKVVQLLELGVGSMPRSSASTSRVF
jgi:hypothetical protein